MSAVCATGARAHSIGFLQCECEIRKATPAWGGRRVIPRRTGEGIVYPSGRFARARWCESCGGRGGGAACGALHPPPPTLVMARWSIIRHHSKAAAASDCLRNHSAESADSSTPHPVTTQHTTQSQDKLMMTRKALEAWFWRTLELQLTSSENRRRRSSVSLLEVKSIPENSD